MSGGRRRPKKPPAKNTELANPSASPPTQQEPGHLRQVRAELSFEGPLPPPAWIEGYDALIPDGANRLFTIFEEQSRNRMHLEKTVIEGNVRHARLGLFCGTGSILTAVLVAAYLALNGHDWAAVGIAGPAFAALGAAYVTGSFREKTERVEKAERAARQRAQRR